MRTPLFWLMIFAVVLSMGCDEADDCDDKQLLITLAGEILYDDYESGPIEIRVIEEQSDRCGENGHITSQTPGETIGTVELDQPGPFALDVTVRWVGYEKPGLYILATNNAQENGKCKAGGTDTAPTMEQDDITIELVTDDCPVLQ